jgi:hypothetical protein
MKKGFALISAGWLAPAELLILILAALLCQPMKISHQLKLCDINRAGYAPINLPSDGLASAYVRPLASSPSLNAWDKDMQLVRNEGSYAGRVNNHLHTL